MIISGRVRYHDDLAPLLQPIELIKPHPRNPSSGDQDQIEESIEINGMYRPVYAQRSTGYVLAGNTTYAACLGLGASQIPIIWLDVNDHQATRILLGDNQLARLALVDQGLLDPLLDQLLQTELQLLGTGYQDQEVRLPKDDSEPGHTVSVWLGGENAVAWFDLPGANDKQRLFALLDAWVDRGHVSA